MWRKEGAQNNIRKIPLKIPKNFQSLSLSCKTFNEVFEGPN